MRQRYGKCTGLKSRSCIQEEDGASTVQRRQDTSVDGPDPCRQAVIGLTTTEIMTAAMTMKEIRAVRNAPQPNPFPRRWT